MGSGHSQPRSAHYERPSGHHKPVTPSRVCDDALCVSISNKLVERLVDDAPLPRRKPEKPKVEPKDDRMEVLDKIFMEQLKTMDDRHSERLGLTIPEVNHLATRVERRIDNMFGMGRVCAGCQQAVIDCYAVEAAGRNSRRCAGAVDAFKKCVKESTLSRLHARHQRESMAQARRSRDVERARERMLRNYVPRLVEDGAKS